MAKRIIEERNQKTERSITSEITKAIIAISKGFDMKADLRELLLAFVDLSDNSVDFEASYQDITNAVHIGKYNEEQSRRNCWNTKNALKRLWKWQEENRFTFIEKVESGSKEQKADGTFDYHKTKYRFIILRELLKEVESVPEEDLAEHLRKVFYKILNNFKPVKKDKVLTVRQQMKKDESAIYTLYQRVFRQAIEVGKDPIDESQKIIKNLERISTELEALHIEDQAENEFYEQFNRKYAEIDEEIQKIIQDYEEECKREMSKAFDSEIYSQP